MKLKAKLVRALKIWLVIYPSITTFLFFFSGYMAAWPLYARTFILTLTLVPWMMFVGLPLLETILKTVKKITK